MELPEEFTSKTAREPGSATLVTIILLEVA